MNPLPKSHYRSYLDNLHKQIQPEVYLEIGVRDGGSFTLSSCLSIGIDPRYNIVFEIHNDCRLFKCTSDDFFKDNNLFDITGGKKIDLAFIDGMHLSEFAYRDFINILPYCHQDTVIVVDDIIPASIEITTREQRIKGGWTGDVYKVISYLMENEPCDIFTVDTIPSGLAIITNFMDVKTHNTEQIQDDLIGDRYEFKTLEQLRKSFSPLSVDTAYDRLRQLKS